MASLLSRKIKIGHLTREHFQIFAWPNLMNNQPNVIININIVSVLHFNNLSNKFENNAGAQQTIRRILKFMIRMIHICTTMRNVCKSWPASTRRLLSTLLKKSFVKNGGKCLIVITNTTEWYRGLLWTSSISTISWGKYGIDILLVNPPKPIKMLPTDPEPNIKLYRIVNNTKRIQILSLTQKWGKENPRTTPWIKLCKWRKCKWNPNHQRKKWNYSKKNNIVKVKSSLPSVEPQTTWKITSIQMEKFIQWMDRERFISMVNTYPNI
jgi:hypothetical protein